jgi:hypothetical protein
MSTKDTSALKLPEAVKSAVPESAEVFLKLRAGEAKPSDMKSVLQRASKDAVAATDR